MKEQAAMTPQPPAGEDAELIEAMGHWCKSFAHNAPLRRVLESAADTITRLRAELAAVTLERDAMQIAWEALQVGAAESERDAERYRFIREAPGAIKVTGVYESFEALDSAIDAAIAKGKV
jgi:hypothetical protein